MKFQLGTFSLVFVFASTFFLGAIADAHAKDIKVFESKANPLAMGFQSAEVSEAKLVKKFTLKNPGTKMSFSVPEGWNDHTDKNADGYEYTLDILPSSGPDDTHGSIEGAHSICGEQEASACGISISADFKPEGLSLALEKQRKQDELNRAAYKKEKFFFKTIRSERKIENSKFKAIDTSTVTSSSSRVSFLNRTIFYSPPGGKETFEIRVHIPAGTKDSAKTKAVHRRLEKEINAILNSVEFSKE